MQNMLVFALSLLENVINKKEKMTVLQLRAVALKNELVFTTKTNKKELLQLLVNKAQENINNKKLNYVKNTDAQGAVLGEELVQMMGREHVEEWGLSDFQLSRCYPIVEVPNYVMEAHASKYGYDKILGHAPNSKSSQMFGIDTLDIDIEKRYRSNGECYEAYVSLPMVKNGELVLCEENNTSNNASDRSTYALYRQLEISNKKFIKEFGWLDSSNLNYYFEHITARMKNNVRGGQRFVKVNSFNGLEVRKVVYDVNGEYFLGHAIIDRRHN